MRIDSRTITKLNAPEQGKRRRIWEIDNNWHCSIIGTCLTLKEIQGLAKKIWLRSHKDKVRGQDALFHGHFVREASKSSTATKLLNKLLDKKFSSTIKRYQKLSSGSQLSAAWDASFAAGDIPGPYWAIISHPTTSEALGLQVYGDVHMLSHLVGASNRKDRILLHRLEAEKDKFDNKIKILKLSQLEALKQKDQLIRELGKNISSLKEDLSTLTVATNQTEKGRKLELGKLEASRNKIKQKNQNLENAQIEAQNLKELNERLDLSLQTHKKEIKSLEDALSDTRILSVSRNRQFDLSGNRILYVGGRQRLIGRLQTLVSNWNGILDHHDGGIEQSMKELNQAISKADVVVFPIDCVSHNAANRVKQICNHSMKPFTPLRSTGLGSLILGLQNGLKHFALSAQQNK